MTASSASSGASLKFRTRVSAAELRAWAPFVRKDAIRAGDVVLSRGRGLDSSVIAGMTGGHYSHAAIFLPFKFEDQRLPLKVDLPDVDTDPVDFDEAMRKYGSILLKGGDRPQLNEPLGPRRRTRNVTPNDVPECLLLANRSVLSFRMADIE
jgi:hypothetical protein